MEEDKIYSTRDLSLAATLLCLDYNLVGIDFQVEGMANRPIGYFNFTDSKELRDSEQDYLRGKVLVDPKLFMTNLHMLKAQVVNIRNSPEQNK